MMPRGCFGTEYAIAPLDAVEVHLKNPLLGPEQFDQAGKPHFHTFAQPAAPRPEKQVLRHLLTEGTGAAQRTALLVVFQSGLDSRDIEAPVFGELLILAGNHCHLQVIRQFAPGAPAALQIDGLIIDPGLNLALDHQRGAGWWYPAE